MRSWLELRRAGLAEATSVLESRSDSKELRELLVEWIGAIRDLPCSTRAEVSAHPATATLADDFHAVGLDALCNYVRSFAEVEGPIHSGQWLFAILLGRACAADLAVALAKGGWRTVRFWGHEEFGAWDAFKSELLRILKDDEAAGEGAWGVMAEVVEETKRDPGRFTFGADQRAALCVSAKEYMTKPYIEQAWEARLGDLVTVDQSFIFGILRKLDTDRFMTEAAKFPHPAFFKPGLDDPNLANEREIACLIAKAPVAFDSKGEFQRPGMIAVHLLGSAAKRIRHLAGDGRVYPQPLNPDEESQLRASAASATAAADVVIDALFSRPDATFLAWAWLERLIFEGERRGFWHFSIGRDGVIVDPLMILVPPLSSRLKPREDAVAWVLSKGATRRCDRVAAVLAAAAFSRALDSRAIEGLLRSALMSVELRYYGTTQAITRPNSPIGRIGGQCVLAIRRPDAFLAKTWQQLRPFRERSWRSALRGEAEANVGELLALWGIFALNEAPTDLQPQLLLALETILCDAFQTDAHVGHSEFWLTAIERFGYIFGKTYSGASHETESRLLDLLRPYVCADEYLIRLVVSLNRSGIDAAMLNQTMASFGMDLPALIRDFLASRQPLIVRGHYSKPWLDRARALCGGGEQPDSEA